MDNQEGLAMRALRVLLGLALLLPAAPARAAGPSAVGGCTLLATEDTYTGGMLGGPGFWTGVVTLSVAPLDATGAPTFGTVFCDIVINGVWWGRILGPTSDTNLVTDAAVTIYPADETDVVTLCTNVVISATLLHKCAELAGTQVPPTPLADMLTETATQTDPAMCEALKAVAPGAPGAVDIDPSSGDTRVGGMPFWDCPPYDGAAADTAVKVAYAVAAYP